MTLASVLPAPFANAIPSIRWPLNPTSCPPLYFQSLESLKSIRREEGLELLDDLPSTLESLFPPSDVEKRHYGLIATALILIGNGYTDECHNLITPLSWPDDIHFAYGPSVYTTVLPEARSYASYVHCLVHRKEGFNTGEFGMVGFANANYWSNAVARSEGVHLLPHSQLVAEVRRLAHSEQEKAWVKEHLADDVYFESRALHELCANVLRGQDDLHKFAARASETEVRILLAHVLRKAGFDVTLESVLHERGGSAIDGNMSAFTELHEIDEYTALKAGKKVSSAHLRNFQSGGFITIRQVLSPPEISSDALSAAAGIACRLLNSPTCRLVNTQERRDRVLLMALPTSEEQVLQLDSVLYTGGGSLTPGDLIAKLSSSGTCQQQETPWFAFVPCEPTEPALFVDRLYGTQGETPTTVIQWSKGTTF